MPRSAGDKPPIDLSNERLADLKNSRKIKVKMFSLDGRFIREFDSLQDAGKFIGLANPCQISANCRGKTKSAGGYLWEYSNPKKAMSKKKYSPSTKKKFLQRVAIRIQRADSSGNINIYPSIKEAAMENGLSEVTISKYAETHEAINGYRYAKLGTSKAHSAAMQLRPVTMLDLNGNILQDFPSIKAAKEYMASLGKDGSCISKVCQGKRTQTCGYGWRYTTPNADSEYLNNEKSRKQEISTEIIEKKHRRMISDIAEFKKIIHALFGDDYEILSTEYHSQKDRIKVLHRLCGTIYETSARNLLRGMGCRKCSYSISGEKQINTHKHKPHKTTEAAANDILRSIGPDYKLLSEYSGGDIPLTVQHIPCRNDLSPVVEEYHHSPYRLSILRE